MSDFAASRRSHLSTERADTSPTHATGRAPGKTTRAELLAPATATPPVQARGELRGADAHAWAAHGTRGAAAALPHGATIQQLFGHHDLSGVRAAIGGAAGEASAALGAQAYASGDAVAFAQAPDLHLAAHEAAHVVQQRGGVRLSDGLGQAGDAYEQHADAVADLVVRGVSAEALLDRMAHRGQAGGRAVQGQAVQRATATAVPASGVAVPGQPAAAAPPAIRKADVGGEQELIPETKLKTAFGTLKLAASATLKLDPSGGEAEAGGDTCGQPEASSGVDLSFRGSRDLEGARDGQVEASNLLPTLAARLGLELKGVADTLSISASGKGSYTLGTEEVALPSFGPVKSKFSFSVLEASADKAKPPEVAFGTMAVTSELPIPISFGVEGVIEVELGFEPNWPAILEALGLSAGELAAGALGAGLVTYLVAQAYAAAEAEGRREGLATYYIPGYAHALADAVYGASSRMPSVPTTTDAITGSTDPAACAAAQQSGIAAGKAAAKALSAEQLASLKAEYSQVGLIEATELGLAAKLGVSINPV